MASIFQRLMNRLLNSQSGEPSTYGSSRGGTGPTCAGSIRARRSRRSALALRRGDDAAIVALAQLLEQGSAR